MLVAVGDRERPEDQREDEDVVDREALLDQVAGEVLPAGLRPHPDPDPRAERDGEPHPDRAPQGGFAQPDGVRIPMHHEQVQHQHRDDEREEGCPYPEVHVHVVLPSVGTARRVFVWPSVPAEGLSRPGSGRATGSVADRLDGDVRGDTPLRFLMQMIPRFAGSAAQSSDPCPPPPPPWSSGLGDDEGGGVGVSVRSFG